MKFNSLHDVYVHELKDLYSAEKRIVDALQEILDQEGAADQKLTSLAEGGMLSQGINEKARA